jgi:hypothetical protein
VAYNFAEISDAQAIALIRAGDPAEQSSTKKFDSADLRAESEVRQFLKGDHWQDGDGWVGPKPSTVGGAASSDQLALDLIAERFVSRNMIEDVTTRHVDGVLGRDPKWGFTPKRALKNDEKPDDAEQASIDEVEAAMTAWWNKRQCHQLFQGASVESLLSGRAVLRVFVPGSRLQALADYAGQDALIPGTPIAGTGLGPDGAAPSAGTGGGPQSRRPLHIVPSGTSTAPTFDNASAAEGPQLGVIAASLEEALDHIYVEVVTADFATVYTDIDSQDRIGVVLYFGQGPYPGTIGPRIVEMTYLDGTPNDPLPSRGTVIRSVTSGGGLQSGTTSGGDAQDNDIRTALPLGGRLTHFAVTRPPLISPQIVSLQKALNLACSMLPRNVETSGFLERILLNSQLPGEWELDPKTGERTGRFKPAAYVTGAGTTQNVQGSEIDQPDGTKQLATPSVVFRPPSPVQPTVDAIDKLEAEILKEAKQGHALGLDKILSGISREQARADFEKSLSRSEAALNPAGRWLLETVLALGELFAKGTVGASGDLSTTLRAEFECIADTGPLDAKELLNITAAAEKSQLSLETLMLALGVTDVDAEQARLNAQPGRRITLATQLLVALKAGVDAGLSLGMAAELAGYDAANVKAIQKDELMNPVPAPLPGGAQQKLDPLTGQPMTDPKTGLPMLELAKPGVPQKPPFGQKPPAGAAPSPNFAKG